MHIQIVNVFQMIRKQIPNSEAGVAMATTVNVNGHVTKYVRKRFISVHYLLVVEGIQKTAANFTLNSFPLTFKQNSFAVVQ